MFYNFFIFASILALPGVVMLNTHTAETRALGMHIKAATLIPPHILCAAKTYAAYVIYDGMCVAFVAYVI